MAFNFSSMIIAIVSFGILYYFLQKKAFGPLFGIMEKRREHIQDQITSAEKNRLQTEQLLTEQKEAIQQARKDAYDIIEQAKLTSGRLAEEITQHAAAESSRIKEEAMKDIENEKNKAVAALRSQVSAMSVLIASKIIEKQVDEKSQKELIDQYLNQVGGNL